MGTENGTVYFANTVPGFLKCVRAGTLPGCQFRFDDPDLQCATGRSGKTVCIVYVCVCVCVVCMYVCMYVCGVCSMYVCMCVCVYAWVQVRVCVVKNVITRYTCSSLLSDFCFGFWPQS